MGLEPIKPDQEFSEDVKDDLRNVFLYRTHGDEKYKKAYQFYEQAKRKIDKKGRLRLNQNTLSVLQEAEKIYREEGKKQNPEQISYNEEDMSVICKQFGVDPETFQRIINKYNDVHRQIDTRLSGYTDKIR